MPRNPRNKWLGAGALSLLGGAWLAFPLGCTLLGIRTYEEAGHRAIESDGRIELRQYQALVVIETLAQGDMNQAGNQAFNRLFGYISGQNTAQQKIDMTTPVLAKPEAAPQAAPDGPPQEGQRIEMTTPVLAQQTPAGWRYAFVLPASITLDNAPAPTNPEVKLAQLPARRVAVIRYSGGWSEQGMQEKSRELADWIAAKGLKPLSSPRAAAYDPPWTIPFLRRNEVQVDVE